LRVDLHSHTRYSRDSILEPAELLRRARRAGLDRIAITDHNVIDGAQRASELDPAMVIVGEEVNCREGTHLIGLFLHERVPPGLPVEEVALRIREQGGVVYAPHPFAYLRSPMQHATRAMAVADAVEVFNSRAFLPLWNRRALGEAVARGLPLAAGSDGHFAHEIGAAWTELPAFESAEDFRRSLSESRAVGVRTQNPLIHLASFGIQVGKAAGKAFGRNHRRRADALNGELEGARF
jgi:predicted metal-dependent phosphoesterase TrpH